jgi:hypothetical protein
MDVPFDCGGHRVSVGEQRRVGARFGQQGPDEPGQGPVRVTQDQAVSGLAGQERVEGLVPAGSARVPVAITTSRRSLRAASIARRTFRSAGCRGSRSALTASASNTRRISWPGAGRVLRPGRRAGSCTARSRPRLQVYPAGPGRRKAGREDLPVPAGVNSARRAEFTTADIVVEESASTAATRLASRVTETFRLAGVVMQPSYYCRLKVG